MSAEVESTLRQVMAGVLWCCIYIVRLWQADFGSEVVMAGVNMSFLLGWRLELAVQLHAVTFTTTLQHAKLNLY